MKILTIRKPDGTPVFKIMRSPKFFGCRVQFHVFSNGDEPGCFHDHPAVAFRLVLWGGYREQVRDRDGNLSMRSWFPGKLGMITPDFEHRIDGLYFTRSISLWFRGPVISRINTRGC